MRMRDLLRLVAVGWAVIAHQLQGLPARAEPAGGTGADTNGQASKAAPALSPDSICATLTKAAADNQLPVEFFSRLIWLESRFNPDAVSPKGAQGIAQFMPHTASERGLIDP